MIALLLAANLVFNPSFETDDGWAVAGSGDLQQRLLESVDIMGNPLPVPVRVGSSPVYLVGGNIEVIR